VDLVSPRVIGRCVPLTLPIPDFLRARLPALVALKPPAEWPDIMLRLVSCVLVLLWVADDDAVELVALVLVVYVRFSFSRPSSYADLRWRRCGFFCCECIDWRVPVDSLLEWLLAVMGLGALY